MRHQCFNNLVLTSIALSLSFIIIFNFTIDPYSVFNFIKIDGINVVKNNTKESMTKFYTAKIANPTVLLIGTSRTEAIDPAFLDIYYPNERIYNLAIPGSGVVTHKRNIEYFIKHHNIKAIVYGLDFFAFNPYNNQDILAKRYEDNYRDDYIDAILSLKTLTKSIKTVYDNIRGINPKRDYSNGWVTNEHQYIKIDKSGGRYILDNFEKMLNVYATSKDFYNYNPFKESSSVEPALQDLKYIINLCEEHRVELKLFISPISVRLRELIGIKGLNATYSYWKNELSQHEVIYDFSGYNSITSDINNYFDASHYQPKVAHFIFAKMFHNKKIEVPDDFGVLLSPTPSSEK